MEIIISTEVSSAPLICPVSIESVQFNGAIEGYSYDNYKSYNYLTFATDETVCVHDVLKRFQEECYPQYIDRINIIEVGVDSRFRIQIKFSNGSRGISNAPWFRFQ
ncbi:MAG: hypothetical protein ACRCX2_00370 [Paraclostridium sp.]